MSHLAYRFSDGLLLSVFRLDQILRNLLGMSSGRSDILYLYHNILHRINILSLLIFLESMKVENSE